MIFYLIWSLAKVKDQVKSTCCKECTIQYGYLINTLGLAHTYTPIERSFESNEDPQLTLDRQQHFIQLMDKFQRLVRGSIIVPVTLHLFYYRKHIEKSTRVS